jgi:hypothetical protein
MSEIKTSQNASSINLNMSNSGVPTNLFSIPQQNPNTQGQNIFNTFQQQSSNNQSTLQIDPRQQPVNNLFSNPSIQNNLSLAYAQSLEAERKIRENSIGEQTAIQIANQQSSIPVQPVFSIQPQSTYILPPITNIQRQVSGNVTNTIMPEFMINSNGEFPNNRQTSGNFVFNNGNQQSFINETPSFNIQNPNRQTSGTNFNLNSPIDHSIFNIQPNNRQTSGNSPQIPSYLSQNNFISNQATTQPFFNIITNNNSLNYLDASQVNNSLNYLDASQVNNSANNNEQPVFNIISPVNSEEEEEKKRQVLRTNLFIASELSNDTIIDAVNQLYDEETIALIYSVDSGVPLKYMYKVEGGTYHSLSEKIFDKIDDQTGEIQPMLTLTELINFFQQIKPAIKKSDIVMFWVLYQLKELQKIETETGVSTVYIDKNLTIDDQNLILSKVQEVASEYESFFMLTSAQAIWYIDFIDLYNREGQVLSERQSTYFEIGKLLPKPNTIFEPTDSNVEIFLKRKMPENSLEPKNTLGVNSSSSEDINLEDPVVSQIEDGLLQLFDEIKVDHDLPLLVLNIKETNRGTNDWKNILVAEERTMNTMEMRRYFKVYSPEGTQPHIDEKWLTTHVKPLSLLMKVLKDRSRRGKEEYVKAVYYAEEDPIRLTVQTNKIVHTENEQDDEHIMKNPIVARLMKHLLPYHEKIRSEEKKVIGKFRIYGVNIVQEILADMLLTEPLFHQFFYMKESEKTMGYKKIFKYQFKIPGDFKNGISYPISGANFMIKSKITEDERLVDLINVNPNYVSTYPLSKTGTVKYPVPKGVPYVSISISGADSVEIVQRLIAILVRILTLYVQKEQGIIEEYKRFIPTFGEDNNKDSKKKKNAVGNITESMAELKRKAGHIFVEGYARKCQVFQPKIIEANEEQEWISKRFLHKGKLRDRQVMRFPKISDLLPGEKQLLLVCPNDKAAYPRLKRNTTLKNKDRFPYIPCCGKIDQNHPGTILWEYFTGEKVDVNRKKGGMKTNKFLESSSTGLLPDIIINILKDSQKETSYTRFGVPRSPSSVLHAICTALGTYEYLNAVNKEEWINKLRINILRPKLERDSIILGGLDIRGDPNPIIYRLNDPSMDLKLVGQILNKLEELLVSIKMGLENIIALNQLQATQQELPNLSLDQQELTRKVSEEILNEISRQSSQGNNVRQSSQTIRQSSQGNNVSSLISPSKVEQRKQSANQMEEIISMKTQLQNEASETFDIVVSLMNEFFKPMNAIHPNQVEDKILQIDYLRLLLNYFPEVHPEICKQELYDKSVEEIKQDFNNINYFLDPALYYRVLEKFFGINIFSFTMKSQGFADDALEIPRSKIYHIHNIVRSYKSVLILKNWGSESDDANYPECELISDASNNMRLYNSDVTEKVYNALLAMTKRYEWQFRSRVDSYPTYINDEMSNLDLETIFNQNNDNGKLKISLQYIDNYGKTRLVRIGEGDQSVMVVCPPSRPLNVASISLNSDMNNSYENVVNLFEYDFNSINGTRVISEDLNDIDDTNQNKYKITGVWYRYLDYDNFLFCPLKTTIISLDKKIPLNVKANPLKPLLQNTLSNSERLRRLYKTFNLIMETARYLFDIYCLSNEDCSYLDTFGKQHYKFDHNLITKSGTDLRKPMHFWAIDKFLIENFVVCSDNIVNKDFLSIYNFDEISRFNIRRFTISSNTEKIKSRLKDYLPSLFHSIQLSQVNNSTNYRDASQVNNSTNYRDASQVNNQPSISLVPFNNQENKKTYIKLQNREMYERLRAYFTIRLKENNDRIIELTNTIHNYYSYAEDFKSYKDTRIFLNATSFSIWFDNLHRERPQRHIYDQIEPSLSDSQEPYVYKLDSSRFYLIQNTKSKKIDAALYLSYYWNIHKVNLGYDVSASSVNNPYDVYRVKSSKKLELIDDDESYKRNTILKNNAANNFKNYSETSSNKIGGTEIETLQIIRYANDRYAALLPLQS